MHGHMNIKSSVFIMCCVDSRLVHYQIPGRHTTSVSESVPFQQIRVKYCLNVRAVMRVQTLLNVLYFNP